MIKTKTGWAAGFGAAALIVALGLAAAVSPPTPAEARVFVGFGFGFPIGFPYLLSALPLLPAAGLLPAAALLPRPGLLSRARDAISAVTRFCFLRNCREPVDHLHAAARLDKCPRSILSGIPDHRTRGQPYDRPLRDRLPRCERPVEDR